VWQEEPRLPKFHLAEAILEVWGEWVECLRRSAAVVPLHRIDPGSDEAELLVNLGGITDQYVLAFLSSQGVGRSALSVDIVVSIASDGRVLASAPKQGIASVSPDERVMSRPSVDTIMTVATGDPIVSALAEDGVVAISTIQQIISVGSTDPIESMSADERIVTGVTE
tara:strand:- start:74 stop:577 length:504 start_codon:yes stop_codon:yes gene_type:complete